MTLFTWRLTSWLGGKIRRLRGDLGTAHVTMTVWTHSLMGKQMPVIHTLCLLLGFVWRLGELGEFRVCPPRAFPPLNLHAHSW